MPQIPPFTYTPRITRLVADISAMVARLGITGALTRDVQLRRVNRVKTIHSSLAIESNGLSVEQVTALLDGKRVLAPPNEVTEVLNAGRAYQLMDSLNPYILKDLLAVHAQMMKGLAEEAGRLRTGQVGVLSGDKVIHLAPPAKLVPEQIQNLLEWAQSTEHHPLVSSSIFHYELEFIHPFSDGNGRMGRYWQTLLLSRWQPLFAWLPVETVVRARQAEYYRAFQDTQSTGDDGVFVEFMLLALLEALEEVDIDGQMTDQVSDQVSDQVYALLDILGTETLSAFQLMEKLGLSHRTHFRQHYLQPAIDMGLVEPTMPQSPNSPKQKYRRKR